MTLLHSCRKHEFVKGFCCWLYLACVADVERGRGSQSVDGRRGRDEEVASKKNTELRTRVQKSIPYYDQNG